MFCGEIRKYISKFLGYRKLHLELKYMYVYIISMFCFQVVLLFFAKSRDLVGHKESFLAVRKDSSPKEVFKKIISEYSE